MSIVLVIIAFLFLLTGLIGSFIPILPGPPLSFGGLLLLQWSGYGGFSTTFLWMWAAITIIITIADYVLPAWLTKQFGGSRMAVSGSVLGLFAGIFIFPPIGLLIGPFLGALTGELLHNQLRVKNNDNKSEADDASEKRIGNVRALSAALGAFLAFMLGTGAKMIAGSLMIFYAVKAMFM